jgi:hypothetical protein
MHDLNIPTAEIVARPKEVLDLFKLEVETIPAVDFVKVLWRYTTAINNIRFDRPSTTTLLGGRISWMFLDGGSPHHRTRPQVSGHTYTDDNQGTWYIVSR